MQTQPLCLSLAQTIISSDVFYNLPRKFNIALDGGGAVGVVEDTNDIGARAVRVKEPFAAIPKVLVSWYPSEGLPDTRLLRQMPESWCSWRHKRSHLDHDSSLFGTR